jgi:tetratricopeptide (TPR) repeat protein
MKKKRLSLFAIALILIISFLPMAGCRGNGSGSPAVSGTNGAATVSPVISPAEIAGSPVITSPKPSPTSDDIDTADGDEDSNLEDMYVRIYGEDLVVMAGDKPRFDNERFMKNLLAVPKDERNGYYSQKIKQAEKLEKEGAVSLPDAARIYRETALIEKQWGISPAVSKDRLKKLGNEASVRLRSLVGEKKYKDAIPFADAAVICSRSDKTILETAGDVFSETGEEGLAKAYFKEALAINPADGKLGYKLKNMYILEGDFEKAIPLINRDTAKYGRTKSKYDELAQAYLGMYLKDPQKKNSLKNIIAENLKRAIRDTQHIPTAKAELEMNLALFEKKYDKASDLCRKMLTMNYSEPIKTRLIYNLALLEYLQGKRAESIKNLKLTISRVTDLHASTQSENYMAQMSAWFLDSMKVEPYDSKKAELIYSGAREADHSYRQEYGFISGFLKSKEEKKYDEAARYLEKYIGKRHLEPVGDFAQDLLQVPAQKSLIYLSMGDMYEKTGSREKAKKCYAVVKGSEFLKEAAPDPR